MTGPAGQGPDVVLASASPRRRELLAQIGLVPASIISPDIDETPIRGERPADYAMRMALEKLAAVEAPQSIVIAGDTVVAAGRRILPRAADRDEVIACLRLLAGRRHSVLSAVAVRGIDGSVRSRLSRSTVAFAPMTDAMIAAYADSGEGIGKAGGYAIQGRAAVHVRWISGSYSGIVGLPLFETRALLTSAGLYCG